MLIDFTLLSLGNQMNQTEFSIDTSYTTRPTKRIRSAFTLVELLVCISIIGILLALMFPAAQAVRQAARRATCLSNLRQVMMAALSYESKNQTFPPGDNGDGMGFLGPLLPLMEEEALWDELRSKPESGQSYQDLWEQASETEIPVLLCAASGPEEKIASLNGSSQFTTHYYGVCGPTGSATDFENSKTYEYRTIAANVYGDIGLQGLFSPMKDGRFRPKQLRDVVDGASNTFAIGEISVFNTSDNFPTPQRSAWAMGAKYNSSKKANQIFTVKSVAQSINSVGTNLNHVPFASNHPGGTHFALVDGSTQYIDQNISLDVLKIYSSINRKEKEFGDPPF